MAQNRYSSPILASSPIIASFSNDDTDSSTESDLSWGWPENQLGLEPGERFDSRRDDEEVALDDEEEEVALEKKGEMIHHEGIAKY
jgi:hypothetical protein